MTEETNPCNNIAEALDSKLDELFTVHESLFNDVMRNCTFLGAVEVLTALANENPAYMGDELFSETFAHFKGMSESIEHHCAIHYNTYTQKRTELDQLRTKLRNERKDGNPNE